MSNELIHYASEYYDPVKAHEYYEEHKKLKGRKSTAKLNDTGKAAATNIKQNLTAEKKEKIAESKATMESNVKSAKEALTSDIESFATSTKQKIAKLTAFLKGLSKTQRATRAANIKKQINKLREVNATKKAELTAAYKESVAEYKKTHATEKANLNTEYDTKYEDELDKLRSDSSMLKTSSSSSSSSSGAGKATNTWATYYAQKHKKKS